MKHLNLVTKLVQSGAKDTFFTKKYDRKKLKRFQTLAIKAARKAVREVDTKTQFDVQYDGKVLHAASVHGQTWCGADHPSNILHEVAHWAVCSSKKRRSRPDYGLGDGPDSNIAIPMLVNRAVGQKEEERASLLGIFMEFELGMPAADTMRLHSWLHPWSHYDASKAIAGPDGKWSYENPKGFTSAINWLIEKRLLDSNGTVNWAKVSKGVAR